MDLIATNPNRTLEERSEAIECLMAELDKQLPPADLKTEHHLHAGVYSRTIYVPAGVVVAGLTVEVPTQLICHGRFRLTDGASVQEFNGVHIFEGERGRRAAVYAVDDSTFTMLFATNAKTVEEAEREFTSTPERLLTNKERKVCQELPEHGSPQVLRPPL